MTIIDNETIRMIEDKLNDDAKTYYEHLENGGWDNTTERIHCWANGAAQVLWWVGHYEIKWIDKVAHIVKAED